MRKLKMYYSIHGLFSRLKNSATKIRFIKYLEQQNAVDSSRALAYRDGRFEIVSIY